MLLPTLDDDDDDDDDDEYWRGLTADAADLDRQY